MVNVGMKSPSSRPKENPLEHHTPGGVSVQSILMGMYYTPCSTRPTQSAHSDVWNHLAQSGNPGDASGVARSGPRRITQGKAAPLSFPTGPVPASGNLFTYTYATHRYFSENYEPDNGIFLPFYSVAASIEATASSRLLTAWIRLSQAASDLS